MMKSIALLAVISLVITVSANSIETFEQFKAHFNKQYESVEAELLAEMNFMKTKQWISENKNNVDHDIGITWLSDVDDSTIFNEFSITHPHSSHSESTVVPSTLPESFDWRQHIRLHEPEHQGHCGSCWAFVSATCIEARLAVSQNVSVHVSRQELLDCTRTVVPSNHGCHGGHAYDGWQYTIKHGIHEELLYPYKQVQGQCHNKMNANKYYVKEVRKLKHKTTDLDMMINLHKYGPSNVNIHGNINEFKFYKGGIMKNVEPGSNTNNHAVVLMGWGYDHKENVPYWIIRNSWGTSWGEHGYARVQRGINSMGMNNWVAFPV